MKIGKHNNTPNFKANMIFHGQNKLTKQQEEHLKGLAQLIGNDDDEIIITTSNYNVEPKTPKELPNVKCYEHQRDVQITTLIDGKLQSKNIKQKIVETPWSEKEEIKETMDLYSTIKNHLTSFITNKG